jgi:hypothetical protein
MLARVYYHHLFVVACLVLLNGCTDAPTSSTTTSDANSAPGKSKSSITARADIRAPRDESLYIDEYLVMGVPDEADTWSGSEMKQAEAALLRISLQESSHLPRYQSEKSGELFERLTADDNLDMYRNLSLSIDQRIPDALNYLQSSSQILGLYLEAFDQHAVGGSEIVELRGASLRVYVVIMKLFNEFLPTIDKGGPTYPVRMKGLKQLRRGTALMVEDHLQVLTESQIYCTSDLKRMVGYLQNTLPEILPELSEGNRSNILNTLHSLLDDPKMQDLKPELGALVTAVENSTQPDKSP